MAAAPKQTVECDCADDMLPHADGQGRSGPTKPVLPICNLIQTGRKSRLDTLWTRYYIILYHIIFYHIIPYYIMLEYQSSER